MIFLKATYLLFKLYFYDLTGMIWNKTWALNIKEWINNKTYNYALKVSSYNDTDFHGKFIIPMFLFIIGIIVIELSFFIKFSKKESFYLFFEGYKLLFFIMYVIIWGTISKIEIKRRFFEFAKTLFWVFIIMISLTFFLYLIIASISSYYYKVTITPETVIDNFIKTISIKSILWGIIIAFVIMALTFIAIPFIITKALIKLFRGIVKITIDKYENDPLKPISALVSILFSIDLFATLISIFIK